MADLAAARAAYAEEWERACAAHAAIKGPADARMDRAVAAARKARVTDPKAEVSRDEVARWLAECRRASAAFREIHQPAEAAIDAALAAHKEGQPA